MRAFLARWMPLAIGVVLAALWIGTAFASHDSTPFYNDWLIVLLAYLVCLVIGSPKIVTTVWRRLTGRPAEKKPAPERDNTLRHVAIYGIAFFGGAWLLMTPVQVAEVSPGVAVTTVAGRDAAVVAYNRHGPRGFVEMLFGFGSQRVVAIDLATGHHVWDLQLVNDTFYDARVIAAGDRLAYVANQDGLYIIDIDTGGIVGRPGTIDGLREPNGGAEWYLADPEGRRVLTVVDGGAVRAIDLDDTVARPVSDDDSHRWRPAFGPNGTSNLSSGTADLAAVGDVGFSVDDGVLATLAPGDAWTPLADLGRVDSKLADAQIVIDVDPSAEVVRVEDHAGIDSDAPPAVGGPGGYLVLQVEEYLDWGSYDATLYTVDMRTGDILDSIRVPQRVTGGSTSGSGASLVTLEEDLGLTWGAASTVVMIASDGSFSLSNVGRSGLFGEGL